MNSDNDNQGMSRNEEAAADWCMRLFDSSLGEAEKAELRCWIAAEQGNMLLLERMVAVLHHTNAIADMPGFLALRSEALAMMEKPSENLPMFGGLSRRRMLAAVMGVVMIAVGYWDWSKPDVYATAIGERRSIYLEDGSNVSLDADSQISVAFVGDRRMVVLDRGRAKFDVAKDPLRPFSVTAGTQAIVAIGTSFSVELLQDQLRVLLYEGRVDVLSQRALVKATTSSLPYKASASLDPGQELVAALTSGAGKVVETDIDRSISWESGRLDFTDMPLAKAVERFNRYSKVPIIISDSAAKQTLVSGVFDTGDVDSFILGVTSLYDLTSHSNENYVFIESKKVLKENIN